MVGGGFHGVDQRRASPPAVSGALSAAAANRARFLRPTCSRDSRSAERARPRARNRGVLLLPLLVQRAGRARSGLQRSARLGPTRLSLLPVLGERELDARLGRERARDPAT